MSEHEVYLRPFLESDLWLVDRAASDPTFSGEFEWFGFQSSAELRRRWSDDHLLGSSPYNLCVSLKDDDAPVGWVNWRDTDRAGPGVYEIGVLIIPEFRNRGYGTVSQSQLIDYLFATTTAHRVWAGTEVANTAEQKALERCGLRQEGLLREHHFRDGAWRDSYIYAITRPENQDRLRP